MTAAKEQEPRVRREKLDINGYDLIAVNLCAGDEIVATIEFDRLAHALPKITFAVRGTTVACDA